MAIRVADNIRVVSTLEDTSLAETCQVKSDRTTRTIPLTQDKVAIVDDADYKSLVHHRWCANKMGNIYYAVRNSQMSESKRKTILMHRVILNAPDGVDVDHINSNGLDNRRSNLRLCTRAENSRHKRIRPDSISGFKNVYLDRRSSRRPYVARILFNNKLIYIGNYRTPEDAARAYDRAALKHFGEYALTNEMLGLL